MSTAAWIGLGIAVVGLGAIVFVILRITENKSWYDLHEGAEVQARPPKTIGAKIGGRPVTLDSVDEDPEDPTQIDPSGSGRA